VDAISDIFLEERSCLLHGWRDGWDWGGFVWLLVSEDEFSGLKVMDEVVSWLASLLSFSIVLSFLNWLFVFVNSFSELYRRVLFSEADDGEDA